MVANGKMVLGVNLIKMNKFNGDEVEFEHQMAERGLDYYYNDKEFLGEEWSKYEQEKSEQGQEAEREYQKYVAEIAAKKMLYAIMKMQIYRYRTMYVR